MILTERSHQCLSQHSRFLSVPVAPDNLSGVSSDGRGRPGALPDRRQGLHANALPRRLHAEGAEAVIPGRSNPKAPIDQDEVSYKSRWRIEAAFCRLKDCRRVATRYDKFARNFLSAVAHSTLIAFWV